MPRPAPCGGSGFIFVFGRAAPNRGRPARVLGVLVVPPPGPDAEALGLYVLPPVAAATGDEEHR